MTKEKTGECGVGMPRADSSHGDNDLLLPPSAPERQSDWRAQPCRSHGTLTKAVWVGCWCDV